MTHDLTTSAVARRNVLNNRFALSRLEQHLALGGVAIEGETLFFKSHVADLLDDYSDELKLALYEALDSNDSASVDF